jgi:hypothetical protein
MAKARGKKSKVAKSKSKVTKKSAKSKLKKPTKKYMRSQQPLSPAEMRMKEIESTASFRTLREAGLTPIAATPLSMVIEKGSTNFSVLKDDKTKQITINAYEEKGQKTIEDMLKRNNVNYEKDASVSFAFIVKGMKLPSLLDEPIRRPMAPEAVAAAPKQVDEQKDVENLAKSLESSNKQFAETANAISETFSSKKKKK